MQLQYRELPRIVKWISARRLWRWLRRCQRLMYERRLLAQMDDRALSDLGISRADALQEAQRACWDDLGVAHHKRCD